jgi:dihydrofolate synthase/folylpolyglutamate synthase
MFSTEQILKLVNHHDRFHTKLKTIHIAGTNGKGSTSNYVTNILMETSFKVGLYTSPYTRVRFDNIKINQHQISSDDLISLYVRFKDDFEAFKLSEFEIDTFIALRYFYEKEVDYCVIEVGLGGSDDATNIVEPILTVITNIGLDHQDVLGYSYQEIASKKAGIIKENIPLVIGYDINKEALDVIKLISNQHSAPFHQVEPYQDVTLNEVIQFSYRNEAYQLNTLASYQIKNACLAIEIANLLNQYYHLIIQKKHIDQALLKPLLAYRFQIYQENPTLILDGAHNLEGIDALVSSIKRLNVDHKIKIIFGVLKDKPYQEMYKRLKELSRDIVLTSFDYARALHPDDYQREGLSSSNSLKETLHMIDDDNQALYIITGSLYFLREVQAILEEMKR